LTIQQINYDAWWIWYVTWLAAVVFSARTRVQNGRDAFSPGRLLFGVGFILILVPSSFWRRMPGGASATALARPLWAASDLVNGVLFGLVLMGFAFCWWARLHLGRLWSGFTTLKEGHYIVSTGPYGIVRHPIYSGILFSALMSVGLNADILAALGFVCATLGLAIIARIEERFLREQLGAGAYGAYAARVPMLVPKWLGG